MNSKVALLIILLFMTIVSCLNADDFTNYIDNFDKLTPTIITELKTQGSDINAFAKGYSILMWATIEATKPEVLTDLIAGGADPHALSGDKDNLIMLACINPLPEILSYVLTLGLDVNAVNSDGATALMYAASYKNPEIKIAKLIQAGAKPDIKSSNGATALFLACRDGKWDAARALVTGGANLNLVLPDGGTALMYAINAGAESDFVQLMLDKGANASCKTIDGFTAYSIAQRAGSYQDSILLSKLAKAAGVLLPPPDVHSENLSQPASIAPVSQEEDYHEPLPAFKLVKEPTAKPQTSSPAIPTQGNKISLLSSIRVSRLNENCRLRMVTKGNFLFVAAYRDTLLHVYDVSNPTTPKVIGAYNLENLIHDLAISGNYLYIASLSGLYIVDITQPAAPKLLSCIDSFSSEEEKYTMILVWSVSVTESTLYGAIDEGLCAWDITDPAHPAEQDFVPTNSAFNKICSNAGWVLGAGNYYTLTAINTHEGAPFVSGSFSELKDGLAVDMHYYEVFVGTMHGLGHLQMDSAGKLSKKAVLDDQETFCALTVYDGYLLSVGDKSGLKTYDISYDGKLTLTGAFPMKNWGGITVDQHRVFASGGNVIYVLDCTKAIPERSATADE